MRLLPLVVGFVGALAISKAGRISCERTIVQVALWLFVAAALVLIQPAYNGLIRHNPTGSTPMTLIDMGLFGLLPFCMLLVNNANERMPPLARTLSLMPPNPVFAAEHRRRYPAAPPPPSDAHPDPTIR